MAYAHPWSRSSTAMRFYYESFAAILEQDNRWAIVPVTVAVGLSRELPLKQLKTGFSLPRREVSCVVEAQAKLPALDIFFDCLRQVLATYPEIEVLL